MSNSRMQITFAPDIEALEDMGANWYNVVLDIRAYLEEQGFHYERTLGFVNDRELSYEELEQIAGEIADLALGEDNLLYLNAAVIGAVQDVTSFLE